MGVLTTFDNALFNVISEVGNVSGWKEDALRDITALGSNTALVFVTISVAGALAMAGEKKKALYFFDCCCRGDRNDLLTQSWHRQASSSAAHAGCKCVYTKLPLCTCYLIYACLFLYRLFVNVLHAKRFSKSVDLHGSHLSCILYWLKPYFIGRALA